MTRSGRWVELFVKETKGEVCYVPFIYKILISGLEVGFIIQKCMVKFGVLNVDRRSKFGVWTPETGPAGTVH